MKAGWIEHLRTFVRVAEAGSFTAVAAEEGRAQPTVSRRVAALEAELGVRLLRRSTRALTLTEEGRRLLEEGRAILDAAEAAAERVRGGAAPLAGPIRISAPVAFARLRVIPRIGRFLDAHPGVSTEWRLGDRFEDLVEAGADVAIRIGRLGDSPFVARRIGETRRLAVASPGWLARNPAPRRPEDLAGLDCIVFTGLDAAEDWRFAGPAGAEARVRVAGRVRVAVSDAMRAAALAGLGAAVCPTWLVGDDLAAGRLVRLLPEWEERGFPIHALTPARRFTPPRVRAFVAFLEAEFRADPYLSTQAPAPGAGR